MPNETMQHILNRYPWIANEGQRLIISPDSDGFLSALLLMNYCHAEVVGYYDCKVMLCDKDVDPSACTFVDLDIFCREIKSIGHHMVCNNKNRKPRNWFHYDNCIQPNNLRDFDCQHDFQRKYPFATIHLLLALLEHAKQIELAPDAMIPLLFCDGVCNNLFGYPENCLDWMRWLQADDPQSVLFQTFYREIPFSTVMERMGAFFRERDAFNAACYYDPVAGSVLTKNRSRSGHHMILSLSDGRPVNIVPNADAYTILEQEQERIKGFIRLIASRMGWQAKENAWHFSNLKLFRFQKESLRPDARRFNQENYIGMVEGDCFSMAITAQTTIEYTRDVRGYFRH